MMKPWSFGPFGRDMQMFARNPMIRNQVTANAVASLMLWIVRCHAISPQASEAMLALLERPLDPRRPTENQVEQYLGAALPEGSRLWSKEGDTSEACLCQWRCGDHILPAGGKTLWEKVVGPLFYSRRGWPDFRLLVEPEHGRVIAGHRRSDGRVVRLRRSASSRAFRVGAAISHVWYCRYRRCVFLAGYSWSANRSRNSAGGHNDNLEVANRERALLRSQLTKET
jgi:hypothetical protein